MQKYYKMEINTLFCCSMKEKYARNLLFPSHLIVFLRAETKDDALPCKMSFVECTVLSSMCVLDWRILKATKLKLKKTELT